MHTRARAPAHITSHHITTLRRRNPPTGKEKAIRYGAVDAVAAHLSDADSLVRQAAAGAIHTMCVNQDAKPIFIKSAGGKAVDAMAALLRDDSAEVRCNATLAVRCLSELPEAKSLFVKAIVTDLDLLEVRQRESERVKAC